jgi:hypothetical protein
MVIIEKIVVALKKIHGGQGYGIRNESGDVILDRV